MSFRQTNRIALRHSIKPCCDTMRSRRETSYDVFIYQGEWRAGIRYVQDNDELMLWVPVVRVAGPAATAQRVTESDGDIWIAPDEAPSNGETALIGDATGALLLIQRSPPQSYSQLFSGGGRGR